MKTIRLIQIGKEVTTLLSNAAVTLDRIQNEYKFELSYKTIKLDKQFSRKRPHDEYLFKLIKQYMIKNDYDFQEYPIAIIDTPLVDELISINDGFCAVISTYTFKKYSKLNKESCLLSTIAGILPDIGNQITEVHDETRGCPNDFCDNLSDMDIAISKGEYCVDCQKQLFEALEKGLISVQKLAAIYRILDYAAGRKICFVIMPFKKSFDHTYSIIKKSVEKLGYECRRADEVFETRNIIDIINERIIRADRVIADLTNSSPNVFYELGFAHANGKNTILMAQKIEDVPFDLKHRQYFIYQNTSNQNKIIFNNLNEYLKKKI